KTYDLVKNVEGAVITFEIPEFNKQPAAKSKPTGADVFNVNENHVDAGKRGTASTSVNMRTGPTTNFDVLRVLPEALELTILGENTGWFKVEANAQEGWVSSSYIDVNDTKTHASPRATSYIDQQVVMSQPYVSQDNPERVISEVIVEGVKIKENANAKSHS